MPGRNPTIAAILLAAALLPAASAVRAETAAEMAEIRTRAIENCKSNRGVDCVTEAGLREWIEAERKRPPGLRSPALVQKWEAERQSQQNGAAGTQKKTK